MRKDAVFVNAVCKAEEIKLLSPEALLRLSAASFDEAVKMLHDYGYNEGILTDGSFDIDRFIGRQINLLIDFIKEYSPSIEVEEFLLAPFLFNNIKAEYKRKRGGAGSRLYEAKLIGVYEGDYSGLDSKVRDTLVMLDEITPSPRQIDLALTKAMYDYKLRKAKKHSLLNRYIKAEIDTVNIITAQRAKKLKLSEDALSELYIAGGNLKGFITSKEDLPKEYEDFDLNDLVKLETQTDNYLLKLADSKSSDMDSIGPLLGYSLRKNSEFKTVKMILVCIKSDARSDIRDRIRGLL